MILQKRSIGLWHIFATSRTVLLAQATAGVGPLETSGQNVTDIAEVEKEKRHPYYCVHYSRDFAPFRLGTKVAVTCAVKREHGKWVYRQASFRCLFLALYHSTTIRELIHLLLIYCPRCSDRNPYNIILFELLITQTHVIKIFIPKKKKEYTERMNSLSWLKQESLNVRILFI